ncbi:MAG: TetR family transcriptional regulator [Myxococcaceae bacterium]|nr:TetR family transcriptional regulator [Myxococcaceae bacterium]
MPPRDRTKRRVSPTQDRALASVDAILDAAELVLAEHGYARTTTNGIAARAGVNVALLYRYFAGKEAIVGALIERHADTTYAAVRSALEGQPGATLPSAVRALLEALVVTPGEPALHRALVEQIDATKRRLVVQDLRARMELLWSEFLTQHGSELRPLVDPQATMFVLQHAIEAATHAAAFYRSDELSLERALDALTEMVLRNLVPVYDEPHA